MSTAAPAVGSPTGGFTLLPDGAAPCTPCSIEVTWGPNNKREFFTSFLHRGEAYRCAARLGKPTPSQMFTVCLACAMLAMLPPSACAHQHAG